jgi:hypothetical protein
MSELNGSKENTRSEESGPQEVRVFAKTHFHSLPKQVGRPSGAFRANST